ERYTFTADFPSSDPRSQYNGALWNTYDNIGKKQDVGIFVYCNWSPTAWFRFNMNGGLNYTDLKAASLDMSNEGFSGRLFAGTQFTLPKDFRINLNGGYFSSRVQLQGKYSPFYFAGMNVSKDFLKKKLSVSLRIQNPFWKTMKMEATTIGDGFHNVSTNWRSAREFGLSVSYRFGTMKGKIKKVRRGITNDDTKSGGSSGESGGAEGMGQGM
ncbi:MAG: outer membrane beta-barrel protein, partial [Parabacteroides sp.]|nr:outer membrane beta-barrel protein [Parabacteroides sp.]